MNYILYKRIVCGLFQTYMYLYLWLWKMWTKAMYDNKDILYFQK